ncbi:hypothetical protein BH20ACT2_BH20ACT2_00670 [soil metagenome]
MISAVSSRPRSLRPLLAVAAVGLLVALLPAVAPTPAAAYAGAPWFEAGQPYDANFPDPTVVLDGDTYHAYATNTGGPYLPVMTSTDLRIWTARVAYPQPACVGGPVDPHFNDALPCPAAWAADQPGAGRRAKEVLAPGVARIGGRWVAYYAVLAQLEPRRYCISVATAESPLGPFVDDTTAPLVCDADPGGSLDPEPFVDTDGTPYLLWKSEGDPCTLACVPTKLFARRLAPDGRAFAAGSASAELLAGRSPDMLPWEDRTIESPSLVRAGDRLLLFYAGNDYRSASYATGYATCATPLGPCTNQTPDAPLLASRGDVLGPGGASAFTDAAGQLRLAYHHWRAPHVGYPTDPGCDGIDPATGGPYCISQGQRRMLIDEAHVTAAGLQIGGPAPAGACPPGVVPEDGHTDVAEGSTHEAAIDCLGWWGITQGTGAGYDPAGFVDRGQMASFLARLVTATGGDLPAGPCDRFADDDDSVHAASIDRLAAVGVVGGFADGTYRPGERVSRAQMATFLVRVHGFAGGRDLLSSADAFGDDDGSPHEPAIDQAATAGFTSGFADGTYRPALPVTRAQMASFLTRVLDALVVAGVATPPPA